MFNKINYHNNKLISYTGFLILLIFLYKNYNKIGEIKKFNLLNYLFYNKNNYEIEIAKKINNSKLFKYPLKSENRIKIADDAYNIFNITDMKVIKVKNKININDKLLKSLINHIFNLYKRSLTKCESINEINNQIISMISDLFFKDDSFGIINQNFDDNYNKIIKFYKKFSKCNNPEILIDNDFDNYEKIKLIAKELNIKLIHVTKNINELINENSILYLCQIKTIDKIKFYKLDIPIHLNISNNGYNYPFHHNNFENVNSISYLLDDNKYIKTSNIISIIKTDFIIKNIKGYFRINDLSDIFVNKKIDDKELILIWTVIKYMGKEKYLINY